MESLLARFGAWLIKSLALLGYRNPRFTAKILLALLTAALLTQVGFKAYKRGWTDNQAYLQDSISHTITQLDSIKLKRIRKISASLNKTLVSSSQKGKAFDKLDDSFLLFYIILVALLIFCNIPRK